MTAILAVWLASLAGSAAGSPPPKQLVIEHAALHQFEDGPDLPGGYRFAAGETAFADFRIAGYERTEDDKVSLKWTVECQDASAVNLIPPQSGAIATELTPEDKDWRPKVRIEIAIPPHAPTGTYKILMAAEDVLGKTSARRELTFAVRGHAFRQASSVEVQNFGFFRNENDARPITPAAYRPGDTVWMRFDIAGFQLGPGNRYEVGYGLAVFRANGERMFGQEDAARDAGEEFYPKRFVPAGLSLNLQKDIAPGEYTVAITVRDGLAGAAAESKHVFTVEQ